MQQLPLIRGIFLRGPLALLLFLSIQRSKVQLALVGGHRPGDVIHAVAVRTLTLATGGLVRGLYLMIAMVAVKFDRHDRCPLTPLAAGHRPRLLGPPDESYRHLLEG